MTILKVEGMHCNSCVERINKALDEVKIKHQVSLENKTVSVEGDEKTIKMAVEELDDLGFEAIIE